MRVPFKTTSATPVPSVEAFESRRRGLRLNASMENPGDHRLTNGALTSFSFAAKGVSDAAVAGSRWLLSEERTRMEAVQSEDEAREAYISLGERARLFLHGDTASNTPGLLTTRGRDALNSVDATREWFNKHSEEIGFHLGGSAKDFFTRQAMSLRRSALLGVARHEVAQRRVWHEESLAAQAGIEHGRALDACTDPLQYEEALISKQEAEINLFRSKNLDDSAIRDLVARSTSDTLGEIFRRLCLIGEPSQAASLLHDKRILDEDKEELENYYHRTLLAQDLELAERDPAAARNRVAQLRSDAGSQEGTAIPRRDQDLERILDAALASEMRSLAQNHLQATWLSERVEEVLSRGLQSGSLEEMETLRDHIQSAGLTDELSAVTRMHAVAARTLPFLTATDNLPFFHQYLLVEQAFVHEEADREAAGRVRTLAMQMVADRESRFYRDPAGVADSLLASGSAEREKDPGLRAKEHMALQRALAANTSGFTPCVLPLEENRNMSRLAEDATQPVNGRLDALLEMEHRYGSLGRKALSELGVSFPVRCAVECASDTGNYALAQKIMGVAALSPTEIPAPGTSGLARATEEEVIDMFAEVAYRKALTAHLPADAALRALMDAKDMAGRLLRVHGPGVLSDFERGYRYIYAENAVLRIPATAQPKPEYLADALGDMWQEYVSLTHNAPASLEEGKRPVWVLTADNRLTLADLDLREASPTWSLDEALGRARCTEYRARDLFAQAPITRSCPEPAYSPSL